MSNAAPAAAPPNIRPMKILVDCVVVCSITFASGALVPKSFAGDGVTENGRLVESVAGIVVDLGAGVDSD